MSLNRLSYDIAIIEHRNRVRSAELYGHVSAELRHRRPRKRKPKRVNDRNPPAIDR